MLNIIFFLLMLAVFGKLAMFAFKATWGIAKILVTFVLLPIILIALVIVGFITIAIPLLIIIGIIALIKLV